jgi:hypothetical protein
VKLSKAGLFLIRTLVTFVLVSTWGAVARATTEGAFNRTLKVTGEVDLRVSTGLGHLTVRKGSSGTVNIHGTIRASSGWHLQKAEERVHFLELNPPIAQDGNIIRVGYVEDSNVLHNVSISYEITVPAETRLRSEIGNGSTAIEGINGPIEASTGNGSINLHDIKGNLRANTSNGQISGRGLGGAVTAATGNGSIRIEESGAGDFDVQTGSGSIELSGLTGSLRARTENGDIEVSGEKTGEWRLHSGSGNVTVHLPQNAAFDLEAQATSGEIQTDRRINVQSMIGKHELRGKVGSGGPLIDLSTSSGSIRIE